MGRSRDRSFRTPLLALFAVSGFCGLIYESIWSHYLRLMLGHAAYAQTLVLAIFMGGMALGAWLASRYSESWRKPLIAYAVIEAIIGLSALLFHDLFVRVLDLFYGQWIPALGVSSAATLKWTLAAALILPQSVLLGTTFPLMSASIIRRVPHSPGATLAMLYFTNSSGAAFGVLFSGFVLIPRGGLPGTIAIAGLLNLVLAAFVWTLARRSPDPAPIRSGAVAGAGAIGVPSLLLVAAFVTGVASFFYEIGWIRMLSLVLGTTNQAFELMLSAFILGLALGGLWIRSRLDRLESPLRFAGHVQILMGSLAVLTLPVYGRSFDLMAFLVRTLEKTDRGYVQFHLGSHAIALAVMLPATVMAGMTLPVFTYALLKRGCGERSIGRVYAANTVGAIVGVLLAVHWIMPAIGAKGLVILGGVADVVLGAVLLAACRQRLRRREWQFSVAAAVVLLIVVGWGARIDPRRTASGVYRTGESAIAAQSEIVYHKDGKTASVALIRDANGWMRITTNGKPDAQINVAGGEPAPDEVTMALLAALPLALHPRAQVVANIGMGSGMTSHVLLGAETIRRVDTVEIESAMVEAARGFGPFVDRVYSDPRSRIHVEDAKTFFAARATRYDLIISEPSNPWVSGVASLFSEEFYGEVADNLAADGLLVQWLQLYETNVDLLSSVFKALATEFDDYVVFNTDNANIVVVASKGRALGGLDGALFEQPLLRRDLARVGIHGLSDLQVRRVGSRRSLGATFAALRAPSNSDYHPYLSYAAPKSRFLGEGAVDITRLHVAPVPVMEMLDFELRRGTTPVSDSPVFTPAAAQHWARGRLAQLTAQTGPDAPAARREGAAIPDLQLVSGCESGLDEDALLEDLLQVAATVNPFLQGDELGRFWRRLSGHRCYAGLSRVGRTWLELHAAVAARDGNVMFERAGRLLDTQGAGYSVHELEYLVAAGLSGALADDRPEGVRQFESWFAARYPIERSPPFYLRVLLDQAASRRETD
jgi:spermidine synthase